MKRGDPARRRQAPASSSLERLVESSHAPLALLGSGGEIVRASGALARLLRERPEELVGRAALDFLDRKGSAWLRAAMNGQGLSGRDGSYRGTLQVEGRRIGCTFQVARIEGGLGLLELSPAAVPADAAQLLAACPWLPALHLDGKGVVIRAAAAAAKILGETSEALAGRPLRSCIRFSSARELARVTEGAAADVAGLPAAKAAPGRRIRVVSGRVGTGSEIVAILSDDAGLGLALEARDRARLEHQTFLRSVSHDLRVPLASAAGYASLLGGGRYREGLGADGAYFLTRLKTNVEQMDEMLHHLLELSRVGASTRSARRVRMKSVVDKVIEQFAPKIIETGGQVRVAPDLPDAVGDEIQLRRVFQNLVDNAVKYRGEPPLLLEIAYERGPEGGAFTVRDNGIGIPEAFQPKIWEPFKKLDPNKPGSGVGLSLVKRIVEEHGGRIWVRSTPGKGSTFFLDLPLARG